MKCIILGGTGFIGYAAALHLRAAGHQVGLFSRTPPDAAVDTDGLHWFRGDFNNKQDVASAIAGADAVIQCVSSTIPATSNQNPYLDASTNILGTLSLLEEMHRQQVPKIIFISSGGCVYGPAHYTPIDEAHPTNPINSYGATKLSIEKYIGVYSYLYGLRSIILRLSNPFGATQTGLNGQGVIGSFFRHAHHNEPLEIWGDGSVVRDYVYIDDISDAILKALDYSGDNSLFNIGSGVGTSINQLIEELERVMNRTLKTNYHDGRPSDTPVNILDNTLAQTELCWRPRVSLRQGLNLTYEHLQNPQEYVSLSH